MSSDGTIRIRLVVDTKTGEVKLKGLEDSLKRTEAQFQNSSKRIRSSFERIGEFGQKIFFGVQGLKMLTAPIGNLIRLADKQETAERKVAQAVKSTGMAAGFTAGELKKMASDLQSITTFGDEDILNNVTAQLLTFTNIQGEAFEKAQMAVLNLSTVLDSDLKSASIQLGKALNDPVANLSALSRSGIQFSKDQKKLIKTYAETNQLAKAQSLILEELNKQYGGQAQALAKTSAGQMKQFALAVGDLKEKVGELIKKALLPLLNMGKPIIEWLNNASPSVVNMAGVIGMLTVVLWKIIPAIAGLTTTVEGSTVAIKVFGVSLRAALGWITLAVTAATLFYAAWANNLFGFQEKLKIAWEYLKSWGASVWAIIKGQASLISDAFSALGGIIAGVFDLNPSKIKANAEKLAGVLTNNIRQTAGEIKDIWKANDKAILEIHKKYAAEEERLNQEKVKTAKKTTSAIQENEKDRHKSGIDMVEGATARRVSTWKSYTKKFNALTEERLRKTQESIDKRMARHDEYVDFLYETDRISVEQYSDILERRIEYARENYGEDSLAYMELVDRKEEVEAQNLFNYRDLLQARLIAEAEKNGKETLEYKRLQKKKEQADLKYAKGYLGNLSGLMNAFKGHSRALFNIGKGAAIAQAIIDTIQASIKAFKNFGGWPFGIIPAATTLAMGYARVRQISAVKYAKGGLVDQAHIGLVGEAGPEVIAPKKSFIDVVNDMIGNGEIGLKSDILSRAATSFRPGPANTGNNDVLAAMEDKLDRVANAILGLKIEHRIDKGDLYTVVEAGQANAESLEF